MQAAERRQNQVAGVSEKKDRFLSPRKPTGNVVKCNAYNVNFLQSLI